MEYKLGLLSKEIEHVQGILKANQSRPLSPLFCPSSSLPLDRDSYLPIIYGNVKYFKQFQDETGRILDPLYKKEIQYSTPCFSFAASILVHSGRYPDEDFLTPGLLALESSLVQLVTGTTGQNHSNFYTFPAIQAYEILKHHIPAERHAKLTELVHKIDANTMYDTDNTTRRNEWMFGMLNNLVSTAGEFLRHLHTKTSLDYVEDNLSNHIKNFSQDGLYLEPQPTMAFDHYTRHLLVAMIHRGYSGIYKDVIESFLENSAWVSLMMQSPSGELPVGGRGSQHQWNEAQQCVTFEIWAIRKFKEGDVIAARAFKRAARLALLAMFRWIRPSGEMWVVKNRYEPETRHGFEPYSYHSQYNLKAIPEGPTPCELGGYVFTLPFHHKTFANCSGLYVEIDTGAEERYDSTGLIRIHKKGVEPLIGPSAVCGILEFPVAIGIGWLNKAGNWNFLAQFSGSVLESLTLEEQSTKRVSFALMYTNLENDSIRVRETYTITPNSITVKAQVVPELPRIKFRFPAIHFDGQTTSKIELQPNKITISFLDSQQVVDLVPPAGTTINLKIVKENVPYVNGLLNIIEGDVEGGELTYIITPSKRV